jgi:hypothetical protein
MGKTSNSSAIDSALDCRGHSFALKQTGSDIVIMDPYRSSAPERTRAILVRGTMRADGKKPPGLRRKLDGPSDSELPAEYLLGKRRLGRMD